MNHEAPFKEDLLECAAATRPAVRVETVSAEHHHHHDELSDNSMLCSTSDAATAAASPVYAIQYSMTAIVGLFVLAALLTMSIAKKYRLLLFGIWVVLMGFVVFLLVFVKETTTLRRRVLHPNVNRFTSWMKQTIVDFCEDIQQDIMLLTNGEDQHKPIRQPKSKIFRRFVRPIFHVFRRKRKDAAPSQGPSIV